tara:strand:+ start:10838 stop:11050 length:213 start_codon:yes stop_codon:yes gene_type:complete
MLVGSITADWIYAGCGTRFVDLFKGYHVMVGYDNVIFGAGIPRMGNDGIMKGDSRFTSEKLEKEVESNIE